MCYLYQVRAPGVLPVTGVCTRCVTCAGVCDEGGCGGGEAAEDPGQLQQIALQHDVTLNPFWRTAVCTHTHTHTHVMRN